MAPRPTGSAVERPSQSLRCSWGASPRGNQVGRCRRRWRRPKGRQKARTRDESIARSARHGAAAPPPRGGVQPRTPRTHGRPSMKRPGDPCHGTDPTERPTTSHARVDMTPSPAASAGMGLMAEGPVMRSVTAMRPAQNRAIPIVHDQSSCSPGLLALGRADPSHPHSYTDVIGYNGPGRRMTSVPAGQSLCGAPAGIEPATPSLPSMRGEFTTPRKTSRDHTTAQARAAAEE